MNTFDDIELIHFILIVTRINVYMSMSKWRKYKQNILLTNVTG